MSDHAALPWDEAMEREIERYEQLRSKFRVACSQVILLNNRINDAHIRYDRAVHRKSYRYVGRLNVATLEGVRNMIYEYAARAADDLDAMQDRFVEQGIMDAATEGAESA